MVRGVFCLYWDVFSHANRGKLQFSLFCGLSLGGELLGSGCNFGNWKASSWNLCLLLFFIVFSFSGCLVVSSSYLNSSAKLFLFVKLGHIKLAYHNLCTLIVVLLSLPGTYVVHLPGSRLEHCFPDIFEHRLCLGLVDTDLDSVGLRGVGVKPGSPCL